MATLTEKNLIALDAAVDACTRTAATTELILDELARKGGQGGDVAVAIARHNSDASAHAMMRAYRGATATDPGAPGLVPAAQPGDRAKALMGDGSWGGVPALGDAPPAPLGEAALAGVSPLAARADHVHPLTGIFGGGYPTGGAGVRTLSEDTALTASDPRKLSLTAASEGLRVRLPPAATLEADGCAFLIQAEGLHGVTVTTSGGAPLGPDRGRVKPGGARLFLLVDTDAETWLAADFAGATRRDAETRISPFKNPQLGAATVLINNTDGHDVSSPYVITMTPIDDTRLFAMWHRRINTGKYSQRIEAAVIAVRNGALEVKSPCILLETAAASDADGWLYGQPFAHVIDTTRVLVSWSVNKYVSGRGMPDECQHLNMLTLFSVEGNALTVTRTLGLSALNKVTSQYLAIYPVEGDIFMVIDRQNRKFLTVTITADEATQSDAKPYAFSSYTQPLTRLTATDFLFFDWTGSSNQQTFLRAMFHSYRDGDLSASGPQTMPVNDIGSVVSCELIAENVLAAIVRDRSAPYGLRAIPLRVNPAEKTVAASPAALAVAASTQDARTVLCNRVRDGAFLVCHTSPSKPFAFTATLVAYNADAFVFTALASKTLTGLAGAVLPSLYMADNGQTRMTRLSDRVYAVAIRGTTVNAVQGGAIFVHLTEDLTGIESVSLYPFTPFQGSAGNEGNMDYPFLACAGETVAVSYRANYLASNIHCVAPITFS